MVCCFVYAFAVVLSGAQKVFPLSPCANWLYFVSWLVVLLRDGPLEKGRGGGGGGKQKIHARENVRKKFMQGKCPKKKIHAQDGPHFDMKP